MTLFKKFDDVKARYEDRIEALSEVISLADIELQDLRDDREAALRNVMNDVDVGALDSRIEAASKRIEALQTRATYAQQEQRQQLASMIDYIADTRKKAATGKEDEYNAALLRLQRMKLEYLAAAGRLGELEREFDAINRSANDCRAEAGADSVRYSEIKSSMSTTAHPSFNGFEAASFNTLLIPDWLYDAAQRGNFPKWRDEVLNDGK